MPSFVLWPVVIAGCAPAPPAAAPEEATVVVPVAEPTAPPSATKEEPAPPAAADLRIIPGRSLAGIELGISRDEVQRKVGKPEEVSEYDGGTTHYYSYPSKGLSFQFTSGVLASAFAYSGRRGGYETGEFKKFEGKTPEGIGMDSTYDDVTREYGPPSTSGNLDYAPVKSSWITYKDRGIGFNFIQSTKEMIYIDISPPE